MPHSPAASANCRSPRDTRATAAADANASPRRLRGAPVPNAVYAARARAGAGARARRCTAPVTADAAVAIAILLQRQCPREKALRRLDLLRVPPAARPSQAERPATCGGSVIARTVMTATDNARGAPIEFKRVRTHLARPSAVGAPISLPHGGPETTTIAAAGHGG